MKRKVMLIADDDNIVRDLFTTGVKQDGFEVIQADNGNDALDVIVNDKPKVCFLDYSMPGKNGIDVLKSMKDLGIDIPTIIMTGFGTMEIAIEAIQLGAYEYITKPINLTRVKLLARRAYEVYQLRQKVATYEKSGASPLKQYEIVGNAPEIQEIYKTIGAITTTPITTNILIEGESGTGKELVARAVHNYSLNKDEPFIDINCTALPENLMESELFGHEKGSFTGAIDKRIGKFEAAESGTVFLDEIGDLTQNLQQKLLRVIQERNFERVGGNKKIPLKARIVAATNKNLKNEIEESRFREDLYYRLNVIKIALPPLRERKGDIPLLVEVFKNRYSYELNKDIVEIDPATIDGLMKYNYPGNVRELENIIKSSIMFEKSSILMPGSLPAFFDNEVLVEGFKFSFNSFDWKEERRAFVDEFEKQFIVRLMNHTHGNVTRAGEVTGLDRKSLQRVLKKYELSSADFKIK